MSEAPPQTPHEEPPIPVTKSGAQDRRFRGAEGGRFEGGSQQPRRRRGGGKPPGQINYNDLYDAIKNGAMGVATGLLMFSVPAGFAVQPGVMDALESRADKFAASWVAVARQDPRIARYLQSLLSGGVWVAAIGNSLAFGLMVGVFSGRVTTVPLPATFFVPELQPFIAARPSPTMENNGDQGTGDTKGSRPRGSVDDVPDGPS